MKGRKRDMSISTCQKKDFKSDAKDETRRDGVVK